LIKYRSEDEADHWLRENDPYYSSAAKNKRKKERYPYETIEMEHRRAQVEIPISNLNPSQLVQFSEVAGSYDEDGNFEL
jgi:hypothetical protein